MIPKPKPALERHLFDVLDAAKYVLYVIRRDFRIVFIEYFETLRLIPVIVSVFFKKYVLGADIKLMETPKAFAFFWVLLATSIISIWIAHTEPVDGGAEKSGEAEQALEEPDEKRRTGFFCSYLGWMVAWSTPCGDNINQGGDPK